jgi:hypothetical protein
MPFPHSEFTFDQSLAVRKHVISALEIGVGKDRAQKSKKQNEHHGQSNGHGRRYFRGSQLSSQIFAKSDMSGVGRSPCIASQGGARSLPQIDSGALAGDSGNCIGGLPIRQVDSLPGHPRSSRTLSKRAALRRTPAKRAGGRSPAAPTEIDRGQSVLFTVTADWTARPMNIKEGRPGDCAGAGRPPPARSWGPGAPAFDEGDHPNDNDRRSPAKYRYRPAFEISHLEDQMACQFRQQALHQNSLEDQMSN